VEGPSASGLDESIVARWKSPLKMRLDPNIFSVAERACRACHIYRLLYGIPED
jgi:hypothetical protein